MDPRLRKNQFGYWEVARKPTRDELKKFYKDKYYQEQRGTYQEEYSHEELQYFRIKNEQRMAVIQRLRGAAAGLFLDVGCGEGYALAFFREHGWLVKGYDFSAVGVKSKNPECLDVLVTGDIFQLLAKEISSGRKYDVVWLQNVLEHVLDPPELLQSLLTLIAKDGVVVVTVPNDFSITQCAALDYKHINKNFWVALPDHLSYFSPESLRNVAQATGWECRELISDFPIDWFLFHPGSNYVRDNSVGKAAHRARLQLEQVIHSRPIEDVIAFWSVLARLGFGRDLTAFLTPITK